MPKNYILPVTSSQKMHLRRDSGIKDLHFRLKIHWRALKKY